MTRRTGGVRQGFQFSLAIFLLLLESADLEEFLNSYIDFTCFAENANFLETNLNRLSEIVDGFELRGTWLADGTQ